MAWAILTLTLAQGASASAVGVVRSGILPAQ